MQSINNILIANRGEIARRIIRTAKQMGIYTFAVYSDDEKNAMHVVEADQSFSLGEGSLAETYLNIPLLVKIAKENNCDAIHPGYGFLSENADFAKACSNAGIIFIGPGAEAIQIMGNKTEAIKFVKSLGIPLLSSISGVTYEEILADINRLQFPLIIKASSGGGGKGMKVVHTTGELYVSWKDAGREALAYFGDSALYLEEYIENARHIEVQILADNQGNIVHLYDRECTIQRRHQKFIEEAPSPSLPDHVRQKMLDASVYIAKSMKYTNAGTIEFLVDKNYKFYFLEMNTRIQVEHPVTEAITGIDIIKEQINIASGKPLSFGQDEIKINGHAVECRLYAEDPFQDFMPSAGKMLVNYLPKKPNIRIDTAFDEPTVISSNYDPLIAKIISHSNSRDAAINHLQVYLKQCGIQGVKTNLQYLSAILEEPDFQKNNISTSYCIVKHKLLKENHDERKKQVDPAKIIASVLVFMFHTRNYSENNTIWQILGPWRNTGSVDLLIERTQYSIAFQLLGKERLNFILNDKEYLISGFQNQGPEFLFILNGIKVHSLVSGENDKTFVSLYGLNFNITRTDLPDIIALRKDKKAMAISLNHIVSPLNGKIVQLNVKEGDKVGQGDILMIIESMKMENRIIAPAEAVVAEVKVANGDQVVGSELLIKLTMLN